MPLYASYVFVGVHLNDLDTMNPHLVQGLQSAQEGFKRTRLDSVQLMKYLGFGVGLLESEWLSAAPRCCGLGVGPQMLSERRHA